MTARGKANRSGRSTKMSQFTPMVHQTVDCPAFRSLTPLAQCLYWRLRRLAGHDSKKNGQAFYSTRDAAAEFDTHQDTVRRAFYLLQARGFIVPVQLGSLGVTGEGRATLWRLTELPTPTNPTPTQEYMAWAPGRDFEVQKSKAPPNKKQKPALTSRAACPNGAGDGALRAAVMLASCPKNAGDGAIIEEEPALTSRAYKESTRGSVRG